MSEVAIEVGNLGKVYRVPVGPSTGYVALRDVIADGCKNLGQRMLGRRPTADGRASESFWALADVSFEVSHGHCVGIIGRNGAGKSTLLKLLSRITDPSTGWMRRRGRVASLLEVGTGFHPELTGRENIFLNGAILGMRRWEIRAKFDDIVAFAEVERFLDMPVKHYSSGMYMRLAFAVAAHLEPEILVIDEVLAVGDMAFQKKCLAKMGEVASGGRTVLFVSHNMQAVRHLCQRCLLLVGGRLVGDGTPGEMVTRYYAETRHEQIDSTTAVHNSNKRRGSGAVRFSNIQTLDEHNQPCNEFEMGSTIRFVLGVETLRPVPDLYATICLFAATQREIVTSARFSVSDDPLQAGQRRTLVVNLPRTCLRPNEYPLYFHLADRANVECYDVVDNLVSPLLIRTEQGIAEVGFDATKPCGYFSIDFTACTVSAEATETHRC